MDLEASAAVERRPPLELSTVSSNSRFCLNQLCYLSYLLGNVMEGLSQVSGLKPVR